jgi:hypothetical protein
MSPMQKERSSEAGSAYIIALLVLVILTIVGLALTLVTQTEVNLGANERTINRTFYAADSGVAVAVAKVLVTDDHSSQMFKLNADAALPAFEDQVTVTPMLPILDAPCNLCQVNSGNDFYNITHAINTTAQRVGKTGGTDLPLAQKRVALMIGLQPWQHSTESLGSITDADLAKISF